MVVDAPVNTLPLVGFVMVAGPIPVPCKLMVCVAATEFNALSVRTALPPMLPLAKGLNSKPRVQLADGFNTCPVAVQAEPETAKEKFGSVLI
jgi:hypothetical protein